IEEQSLGVAERLGGIFEEQQETPLPFFAPAPSPVPPQQSHGAVTECDTASKGQDTPDRQINTGLRILFEEGHEPFLAFAKEERILPSTLCQRINEQALELYADIVIEEENGRFAVISDYHEEVTRWINS
ncbi:MAG: hypothetical protein IJY89_01035, partial [Clostridia bacterium]|nr:hypothetical protein [Clostridia bacterium]